MNNKKLIEEIDKVCEWYYPKVPEVGSSGQWTNKINSPSPERPELGPQIVKYKEDKNITDCDWCGKVCQIRRTHKRIWIRNQCQGWSHRCLTCNKIWKVETGTLETK